METSFCAFKSPMTGPCKLTREEHDRSRMSEHHAFDDVYRCANGNHKSKCCDFQCTCECHA